MKSSRSLLVFFALLAIGVFLYSGCQSRGAERSDSREALQAWPPPLEEPAESWSSDPIQNCLAFLNLERESFDGEVAEALEEYETSMLAGLPSRSIEIREEALEQRYHQIQGRFPFEVEFQYFLTSINATPALLRFAICRDLQWESFFDYDLGTSLVFSTTTEEIEDLLPAFAAAFEAAGLEISEEELRENLEQRIRGAWVHFFHKHQHLNSLTRGSRGMHEWDINRTWVRQLLENNHQETDRIRLRREYQIQHDHLLLATPVQSRFALWLNQEFTVEKEALLLIAGDEPQSLTVRSNLPALTVLAPDWVFIEESPTEAISHELVLDERPGKDGPELHLATLNPRGGWEKPLATLAYLNLRYMSSDDIWKNDGSAPQTRTFHCGAHCPDGLATSPMIISLGSEENHRAFFEQAICRIDPEPRYMISEDEAMIAEVRQRVGCDEEIQASLLARNSPDSLDSLAEAQQVFQTQCAVCHGTTGRGDGPAGVALGRMADFSAPETFQYGSSPLAIFQVLRDGIDHRAMPSFEHLPEDLLWELAHYVNQLSEEDTTQVEPEQLEAICTEYSQRAALQVLDDPC